MKTIRTRYLLPVVLVLLALVVAGCDSLPIGGQAEPTASAGSLIPIGPETVSVTGEVVPGREANLSFETNGQMVELLVDIGDNVTEGDVIARLYTVLLDADVTKAEASLAVAEANLAQVQIGPRAPEINQADSNALASNAQIAVANAQLGLLANSTDEAAILQAEAAVHRAEITLSDVGTQLRYIQQAELDKEGYENFLGWPMTERGIEEVKSWEPDALENYNIALAAYQEATARLEQLRNGANEDDLRAAQAEVWAAAAEYEASVANADDLKTGPSAEDIAVAQAAVQQAQAALEQSNLVRSRAELVAPFSGTVSDLYVREGQYINPGEAIILLANLAGLRIETTDLNEIDVAQISVGDTAIITFDALPDVEINGTVVRIDPRATEGAGVNYTAVIDVESLPSEVRWGMTAFVDIPVE